MKILIRDKAGAGDSVMLTALARDIKLHMPHARVGVDTNFPDIWEGNPYVEKVDKPDKEFRPEWPLAYDRYKSSKLHAVDGLLLDFNEACGMSVPLTQRHGDLWLGKEDRPCKEPYWVFFPRFKPALTVKWWPPEYWEALEGSLAASGIRTVVCGDAPFKHGPVFKNSIDLQGLLTLRCALGILSEAEGVVCPISFPMHAAAAIKGRKKPACVVLAGGRESINYYRYPRHYIHSVEGVMDCSPEGGCWKRDGHLVDGRYAAPAQHLCKNASLTRGGIVATECMKVISPELVANSVTVLSKASRLSRGSGVPRHKPLSLSGGFITKEGLEAATLVVFEGLKRSGQHPFLNWMADQVSGKVAFRNDVGCGRILYKELLAVNAYGAEILPCLEQRPEGLVTDRKRMVIVSFEGAVTLDKEPPFPVISDHLLRVSLLRDPFNHLASLRKVGERNAVAWTKLGIYGLTEAGDPSPELLRNYAKDWLHLASLYADQKKNGVVVVNYNQWVADASYRDRLFRLLKLDRRTDGAMSAVPRYGAGSSFDGMSVKGTKLDVFGRWKNYAEQDWYRRFFRDNPEVAAMSGRIFGSVGGAAACILEGAGKETRPSRYADSYKELYGEENQ